MSIRPLLAALPFALLVQACSGISATSAVPLEDTPWTLVSQDGVAVAPGSRARPAEILLKDKRLGGSGGCNRLMTAYTLDGDKLKFGLLAARQNGLRNWHEGRSRIRQPVAEGRAVADRGSPSGAV